MRDRQAEINALARRAWDSYDDGERALTALGMFPHEKTPAALDDGTPLGVEGTRLLAVAIMALGGRS
jgi:hypothetical protein